MQQEACGHDLNDLASLRARNRRFEHGLVQLGIKDVPDRGVDGGDAMFAQNAGKFAQGQLDTVDQGGSLLAGFIACHIKRAFEVVVDRQKVTGKPGAAVLFSLAAVTFSASTPNK